MRPLVIATAVCALLFATVVGEAQTKDNSPVAKAIVGSWKLVEWVVTDSQGNKTYPFGRSAEGLLIYTADGQMAVQLMNPDATISEIETVSMTIDDVIASYFAYYGTYTVDETAKTITHSLTGSMLPSWIGTDQVRHYDLVDPDHLSLTAEIPAGDTLAGNGSGGTNVLLWERVR